MKDEFEIVEKEIGATLEIEKRAPIWKMPSVMGRDYRRLSEYLKSQDCESSGAPYTRYLDIDWETQLSHNPIANLLGMFTKKWRFQVGMPTSRELVGEGDIKASVIEKKRYVRALHRGPYKKVGKTYAGMYVWMKKNGLSPGDESIESYLNDPTETGQEDAETLVLIPIVNR